ncbi:hypothetical protein GCM10022276_05880 [Sphingomonas limnosediminicola]|jgi:hypothetical protein|uniref:DUF4136 domain-containing protein n=1 Tax=Sphingomonas limnosediminicola TaxID=940133 RepID=A0ABP7KZB2_9SPHN
MMRITKMSAAVVLAVASLALSACATALDTRVTRYQAMPAPQGQTFLIIPGEGMARNGGLEFQRYAGIVAQQLQAHGYVPATSNTNANMIVSLGYIIDNGQVRYVSDPFPPSYGFGPYWGRGGRYGYWGAPFYYGWNDPFWYGGGVDSYVEYHSQIDVHIRQAGTNAPLFDGRAQARSSTNQLDAVIPSLVEAMFTGFPGRNGETVKITIPTRPNGQPRG